MKQFLSKLIITSVILLCTSTSVFADLWSYAQTGTVETNNWGVKCEETCKILNFNVTYKTNKSEEIKTGKMRILLTSKAIDIIELNFVSDIWPNVTEPYRLECHVSQDGAFIKLPCYKQGAYLQCHKYSRRTFTQLDNYFISPVTIDYKGNIQNYFPGTEEDEYNTISLKFISIDGYELKLFERDSQSRWCLFNYKKTATYNNSEGDTKVEKTETKDYIVFEEFIATPYFED